MKGFIPVVTASSKGSLLRSMIRSFLQKGVGIEPSILGPRRFEHAAVKMKLARSDGAELVVRELAGCVAQRIETLHRIKPGQRDMRMEFASLPHDPPGLERALDRGGQQAKR